VTVTLLPAGRLADIRGAQTHHRRRHDRARRQFGAVRALAQVTGLVLGGLLIGQFGWRSVFLTMLAVSLLGLILSLLILEPGSRATGRASLDWMGAILAVGAVGAPFLFIEQLSGSLLSPTSLALLAGGAAVLVLFVVVERHASRPLLDLSLFRSRGFTCGAVAAAFYFVAAVSCYFLLLLYAQVVLGLSPVMAGVLVVPLSLVLTASSLAVGRLGDSARCPHPQYRRNPLRHGTPRHGDSGCSTGEPRAYRADEGRARSRWGKSGRTTRSTRSRRHQVVARGSLLVEPSRQVRSGDL